MNTHLSATSFPNTPATTVRIQDRASAINGDLIEITAIRVDALTLQFDSPTEALNWLTDTTSTLLALMMRKTHKTDGVAA